MPNIRNSLSCLNRQFLNFVPEFSHSKNSNFRIPELVSLCLAAIMSFHNLYVISIYNPICNSMYSSGLAQTSVTTDVKSFSNLQSLLEMLHLCLYLSSLILMLSVNGQVELFTHFQLGSEAINTMIITGTAHQNR